MTIRVVGLGGTLRPQSSTEKSLRIALAAASQLGAETLLLGADALDLPMYHPVPNGEAMHPGAARLLRELRHADALIIGSPGYHGGISGLVKNALDWTEELREDPRPFFDGLAVGCIATGAGWQATMTTMSALRDVVHALRGWPTPLGATVNPTTTTFSPEGCNDPATDANLRTVGQQVVRFAARGLVR
jgi:FMN reductase